MLAHQIKVHKSTDTKTWLIEIYGDRDNGGDPGALQSRSIGGILVVLIGHNRCADMILILNISLSLCKNLNSTNRKVA